MCGITGIINKNNNPVDKLLTKKINNLISHRGPDDEGFYFGDNFAFGHRRLSILDLSQDGHQPMHYNDRYTITYNGEVYNYIELKDELKKLGYSFNSNTDTEVILAAYDKWGESCVNKFNGMWSFALFDRKENKYKMLIYLSLGIITSFIPLGFNSSMFGLVFILVIYLLRGIVTPILRNAINKNTTSNKRATVLSIRSFIIRISFAICAPILGYIAENYSLANSFYVLALVVGVFSLLASFKLSSLD